MGRVRILLLSFYINAAQKNGGGDCHKKKGGQRTSYLPFLAMPRANGDWTTQGGVE